MNSIFKILILLAVFVPTQSNAELFRYEMAKRGQLRTIDPSQNQRGVDTLVGDHLELIQEHHDPSVGKSKIEGGLLGSSTYDFGKTAATGPSAAWSFARAALEVPSRLPGVYQNNRAKDWQHNLDYAYQGAVGYQQAMDRALSDYRNGIKDFPSRVLKPSVDAGISEHHSHQSRLAEIQQKINRLPIPSKPSGTGLEGKIDTYAKQSFSSSRFVNKWDEQLRLSQQIGDVSGLVKNLEAGASLLRSPQTINLSEKDQALIREQLRDWIGSDGLVSESHLNQSGKVLRSGLNVGLRTTSNSKDGTRVRTQLNRGLLLMGLPTSVVSQKPEVRETTMGAMSLAMGSDQAYAEGRVEDADALIGHASEILDFVLGFVPVVSSANDLTQIVSGMVTGHDYSGNRMTKSDYALRGAGVVLGLLPVGGEILKIGKSVISRAAIEGAEAIRASSKGSAIARLIGNDAESTLKTAYSLGEVMKGASLEERIKSADLLARELGSVNVSNGRTGTKQLLEVLADEGIDLSDRRQIINSFLPDAVSLSLVESEKVVYRWHDGGIGAKQYARYITSHLISDPVEARKLLAIPYENKMLYCDRFLIKKGAIIFDGFASPNFGFQGGGRQSFIVGKNVEDQLIFLDRVVGGIN